MPDYKFKYTHLKEARGIYRVQAANETEARKKFFDDTYELRDVEIHEFKVDKGPPKSKDAIDKNQMSFGFEGELLVKPHDLKLVKGVI